MNVNPFSYFTEKLKSKLNKTWTQCGSGTADQWFEFYTDCDEMYIKLGASLGEYVFLIPKLAFDNLAIGNVIYINGFYYDSTYYSYLYMMKRSSTEFSFLITFGGTDVSSSTAVVLYYR